MRKKENQCKRTRFLHLLLYFILVKLEVWQNLICQKVFILHYSVKYTCTVKPHRDCTIFSRNAYCLVTDKRICRIEKWVVLKLLMFDCILTKWWWWCPPRFCNSVCSLLWVAGVEALLSIFSCCLVSVAVLVVMKCSYS
jgi:hypothetical protein